MSLAPLHDRGCGLPVDEPLLGVSKLTKLMSDHVLGDSNRDVVSPIVYHETNAANDGQPDTAHPVWTSLLPDKIWQNRARPCLSSYWDIILQCLCQVRKCNKVWSYSIL